VAYSPVVDLDDLREIVRDVLAEGSSSTKVRELLDDPVGHDPVLWSRLSELGWCGIAVPEQFGGAGGSFVEFGVVLAELGRHVTPTPLLSTVTLGIGALMLAGSAQQRAEWLPRLASGEAKAAVAFTDSGAHGAAEPGIVARPLRGAYHLTGRAAFVLDAHTADLLIVAAREESGALSLFAVEPSQAEIRITPSVDQTRRLCDVRLDGIEVTADAALGAVGEAGPVLSALLNRFAAALACDSFGGAERLTEMTAEYAKERVQFGRPIGTFQAVKHRCASMVVDTEMARVAAESAVAGFGTYPAGDSDAVSIAALHCNDGYIRVASAALQMHGGIGFTWEHDTHLYLKRARLNQVLAGDTAWHRTRLARNLFAG
jgi:alkylation response protein AidB-like acyl-CoA dehydrogenase